MERRSTNVKGFVHFGGDIRSGVEHGIGISLGSASTGSTAFIESISDDTNANLGIRAQGAGTISIGTSSNVVYISGQKFVPYSTTFAWAVSALSSGQTAEITLTTSLSSNLSPGDLIGHISLFPPDNSMLAMLDFRQSATGSSIITITVGNISSTATSTESGTGRITWIDLT